MAVYFSGLTASQDLGLAQRNRFAESRFFASPMLRLLPWLFVTLFTCSAVAQSKRGAASAPSDDLDALLKGDAPTGTLFRLVDAADPKRPLEPRLFWRRIPAFVSANTTPVRIGVG